MTSSNGDVLNGVIDHHQQQARRSTSLPLEHNLTLKHEDPSLDGLESGQSKSQDSTGVDCECTQHGTGGLGSSELMGHSKSQDRNLTIKHEVPSLDGLETGLSKSQDRTSVDSECTEHRTGELGSSELTLILRLQRDMAMMQLQLSSLQDAMRTANTTLQELLQRAFSSD